jgi:hypothetical protein
VTLGKGRKARIGKVAAAQMELIEDGTMVHEMLESIISQSGAKLDIQVF